MTTDTSGPAFPVPGLQNDESFNGISMRDYFAAKAMQGSLACDDDPKDKVRFCSWCYDIADQMLKARK